MKRNLDETKSSFQLGGFYVAEVVDIDDPKQRDRVRVRVHGIMKEDMAKDVCPWAEQCTSLFSGKSDVVGVSSVPKVGSLVYVQFLFGDPSAPVYFGYVRGALDASSYHRVTDYPTFDVDGPEPAELDSSSSYPWNNVIHTDAGVILLDETAGNERISIKHKSGAYIEIKPDGAVVYKSVSNTYDIVVGDKEIYTDGNENYKCTGNTTTQIDGDVTKNIDGKDTYSSGGDLIESIGGKNTRTVSGAFTVSASTISLN